MCEEQLSDTSEKYPITYLHLEVEANQQDLGRLLPSLSFLADENKTLQESEAGQVNRHLEINQPLEQIKQQVVTVLETLRADKRANSLKLVLRYAGESIKEPCGTLYYERGIIQDVYYHKGDPRTYLKVLNTPEKHFPYLTLKYVISDIDEYVLAKLHRITAPSVRSYDSVSYEFATRKNNIKNYLSDLKARPDQLLLVGRHLDNIYIGQVEKFMGEYEQRDKGTRWIDHHVANYRILWALKTKLNILLELFTEEALWAKEIDRITQMTKWKEVFQQIEFSIMIQSNYPAEEVTDNIIIQTGLFISAIRTAARLKFKVIINQEHDKEITYDVLKDNFYIQVEKVVEEKIVQRFTSHYKQEIIDLIMEDMPVLPYRISVEDNAGRKKAIQSKFYLNMTLQQMDFGEAPKKTWLVRLMGAFRKPRLSANPFSKLTLAHAL